MKWDYLRVGGGIGSAFNPEVLWGSGVCERERDRVSKISWKNYLKLNGRILNDLTECLDAEGTGDEDPVTGFIAAE